MNELISVKGIWGKININGDPELHLEDVAKGLGIIKRETKNGIEYERINKHSLTTWLDEFGILNSENEDLPEYIPENIFYKLCFKARNEAAIKFQNLVTDEILPTIRKTGMYSVSNGNIAALTAATGYIKEIRRAMEKQGNTAQEIAGMIEMVCRQLRLPLPMDFVKISPYEQVTFTTLTVNVSK